VSLTAEEAVALLGHASSATRRRGAKRLRALAATDTAPALRAALAREVRDPRTWETQYQMIMALAMTGTSDDVPLLRSLAEQSRAATMVDVALADALVRLGREHEQDATPVFWCLDQPGDLLADGALRAVAMLRLTFSDDVVEAILDRVEAEPAASPLRFWPAVAAAGWSGVRVEAFLHACAAGPREDVALVAKESLAGRYRKVNPL
jgi:hypothetical protein